ncbi:MAG: hypothetical protein GWO28_15585 [candidate division Zixibacteria bacterium]|nr:hypothetical protein [candidate division Zixibacteria bacterium]
MKEKKQTYSINEIYGGGYEVWDYIYPSDKYARELVCFGVFGTKNSAKDWANKHLINED